jgi:hypothetical protein
LHVGANVLISGAAGASGRSREFKKRKKGFPCAT